MKLAVSFLLCFGTALSFRDYEESFSTYHPSQRDIINDALDEQKDFNHGRQLTYLYNGQAMTGIPGTSKQHSGNRLQAKVTVVCKHQTTCVMQLHEPRMGRLNRHVAKPRSVLPTGAFEPIPLEPQQRQKLSLPVRFSYVNGEVSNLFFDGQERPWSANIKRGVLNLLQVKLNPKQASSSVDIVDEVEDQLLNAYKPSARDAQFYRTIEDTIEGQCEAAYTVITPPEFKSAQQNIVNVTKTINFEKCYKRPQLKLNFHFSTPCKSCENKYVEDQKFLKSSSISSYQVIKTKKSNIVNHAEAESQYVFVPFNEESNTIVTYVSQNLQLLNAGVPTRRVQVPVNPIRSNTDMLYNMDASIGREHFQMTGDSSFLEKMSYDKRENKIEQAKYLLKRLTNNVQQNHVQEPATARFTELVNLLRLMPRSQIDQVHRAIEQGQTRNQQGRPGQTKTAMDLFHDALGSAGTMAAVQHLVQKIKQRQMSVQKAGSAIKNLMTARVPSQEMIQELISLAESPIAQRHYGLKQATWLTAGTLMNVLCSSNSDQWAIESQESMKKYCPTSLKQKYVKTLIKKLHSSHKWDDQLIYVKALGNAGIDLSIFELEKIISNKNFNYRNIIRTESILSLRQLISVMPKKIQKVLMPVVVNKLESEDVRITAAYMIMKTQPKRDILDQFAKLVHNERSLQVSSFLDSMMRTLANSSNPCEKEFSNDLKLSLRQSHKVYARPANSKFSRVQFHSKKQRLGVELDWGMSFKGESPLPRQLAASLHSNSLGFWNQYMMTLKATTEGLEQLRQQMEMEQLLQGYGSESTWDKLMSPIDSLSQHYRNAPSSEPKAVISFNLKNQAVGFLPIKRQNLESIMNLGRPTSGKAQELAHKLQRGISLNYNKATMLEEILFKIPTTLGLPVMVHIKVPAVMNVHGAIKVTPSPSGSYGSFQVKALLKPSLVASISVDAQVWSPIVATGVSVVSKLTVQQPIDAKLQINLKDQTNKVHLLFKPPTEQKTLISIETRPSTFTIVQPKQVLARQSKEKRMILGEEGQRVETVHKCQSIQQLGTQFCIKGRYHKTPKHSETGFSFAPMSGPNKIVLSVRPTPSRPNTVVVNLYGKFLQPTTSSSGFQSNLFNSVSSSFLKNPFFNFGRNQQFSDSIFGEQISPSIDSLMVQAAQDNKIRSRNPILSDKNSKRMLMNKVRVEIENSNQESTSFDLLHIFNMDGDFQKVQAKLSQSPNAQRPQQRKVCLNYESVFPTLKMSRHLRNGQVIGKMSVHWGQTCQSNNYIQATKRIEKGQISKLHELQNPEWQVQRDANLQHGQLLQKSPLKHIFEINYNNVPLKVKQMMKQLLRKVQEKYSDQTRVAETRVQNRPQHIKVIVAYDPTTLKKGDVLIKTPKSNTLIKDLYFPSYASPITHKNDYYQNEKKSLGRETLNLPSNVQCYASEYTVKTFHDTEMPLLQSQSYKVLSKDCQSNEYTVLVRRMNGVKNLKEVKINTPRNQITIRPSQWRQDKTKVYINGHDYSKQNHIVKTEAGLPILKVIRQSCHVKIEILNAGVSVYVDRKSVNVEVPPHKRHSQCGICSSSNINSLSQQFYKQGNLFDQSLEQEIQEQMFQNIQHNQLRDFSSTDDILSHYFQIDSGKSQIFGQNWEDQSFSRFAPDSYNKFAEYENEFDQDNKGWSHAQERQWEINQKSSNVDKRQSWFNNDLPEFESINAEFDSFYSPFSQIEQQINKQLRQESGLQAGLIEREEERLFTSNPYLYRDNQIDEESCQYRPFWKQQPSTFNNDDIFARFEQENQQSWLNIENQHTQEYDQEIEIELQQVQREVENMLQNQQQNFGEQNLEEQQLNSWQRTATGHQNRKNKIVETEHELCFSTQPIRCPDDFEPSQERQQTVNYICMNRKNPQAQKMLNEITSGRGQVQQLASMTPTMSRREIVATKCIPNF